MAQQRNRWILFADFALLLADALGVVIFTDSWGKDFYFQRLYRNLCRRRFKDFENAPFTAYCSIHPYLTSKPYLQGDKIHYFGEFSLMDLIESRVDDLPDFLKSYEALAQHFRAHLEGLSKTEKGRLFARFTQRLLPLSELGLSFESPILATKESADEGVDLSAQGKSGTVVLYVQAKLWIDRADDIDSIISKFHSYLSKYHHIEANQQYRLALDGRPVHFCIVTLSQLSSIIKNYKSKEYASRHFFEEIDIGKRLTIIDGSIILETLKAAFTKHVSLPSSLSLTLESIPVRKEDVLIGIISSVQLKQLYNEFGDSLFFENIRDFLGGPATPERPGRTTPNAEIIKTILQSPEKLIARNNGIVFRADLVTSGITEKELTLTRGSIVNGCQTTMCIVQHAEATCYVPVKIVQTEDSWDIAKAANYQNSVPDIDLDLARNLRPQLAKRAASRTGVTIEREGQASAFQVIDAIYNEKIAYNETRLLFIGLFSKSPNNVFASNYTELIPDLVNQFYAADPYGENIFAVLFALQAACADGLQQAQKTFEHPSYAIYFNRLYHENSLPYRCFIGILALSGAVNTNVADRKADSHNDEFARMKTFFREATTLLQRNNRQFLRYYVLATKIWMSEIMQSTDEATLRRDMSLESRRVNFTILYKKLCLESDLDMKMREGSNTEPTAEV